MRGCRRRCADEAAAQRCGSGAPTLMHFSLCKHMDRQSSRSPAAFRTRLPPNVKRDQSKTRSHLHFAHSTRTISAEGCAGLGNTQSHLRPRRARSPQGLRRTGPKRDLTCIRALDTHDLRRGLRALDAHDLRRVAREGCDLRRGLPGLIQNAISPALRALDTHDLRRGLRGTGPKRNLTCISRPRHARSPQRVAFRGAPAAPPPALREKERRATGYANVRCADVKMSRDLDVQM